MNADYNSLTSLTAEAFDKLAPSAEDLADETKFTKSDAEDIKVIERLLDVQEGLLSGAAFYLERGTCRCGRLLTMRDSVFTGLIDAGHSKSFILHTLVGRKYTANKSRVVRCSSCGELSIKPLGYESIRHKCVPQLAE
jgi:hypothetical protein